VCQAQTTAVAPLSSTVESVEKLDNSRFSLVAREAQICLMEFSWLAKRNREVRVTKSCAPTSRAALRDVEKLICELARSPLHSGLFIQSR
jgi:hypothetical protein